MSTVHSRTRRRARLGAPAAAALAFLVAARDYAQESASTNPAEFTVGDIRIDGLQRVAEGTVYNYLPVNIGDTLDIAARTRGDPRVVCD